MNIYFGNKCEYDENGVLIADKYDKGVKITMADGTIFLAVDIDVTADIDVNIMRKLMLKE